MSNWRDVPTMRCRVCESDVPAGVFCGLCGAHLTARRSDGPDWLRLSTYAVAPGQSVLRLSLTSSLFPQLSQRSRAPFRVAMAVLLLALVVFALLRLQAPLVGVAALGLPVLFLIYLNESEVFHDLPVRVLVLNAVFGIGLGVGWALLTGKVVARAYDIALGTAVAGYDLMMAGLAIPVGGTVLMLVVAVVLRLLRPPDRESLDGFLIGALGAICFTSSATLTRLAPQFETGLVSHNRPIGWFLVEAGIRGVALPLIAAAVGGVVGAALWLRRRPDTAEHRRAAFTVFAVGLVTLLVGDTGLGVADVSRISPGVQVSLYAVVTAAALLTLRIVLQVALLAEEHDDVHSDEPVLCPQCEQVVPDMAFCPACGAAARAASRSSRNSRRLTRPAPADGSDAGLVKVAVADAPTKPTVWPGYSMPAGSYLATPPRRTSHRRLVSLVGSAVALISAVGAVLAVSMTPPAQPYVCPPECGPPPMVTPVEANPRFTSSSGDFSVTYPGPGTAYEAKLEPKGVTLDFVGGDGGMLRLFSEPAASGTPRQIADALIKKTFPSATTAYEIPNAMVGYQPGYGEIADFFPQSGSGNYKRIRVVVMVAEKNGLDLIATAVGPYHEFGPDFGSGLPSAANLQLALDMDKYVNSFTWRGDPPR